MLTHEVLHRLVSKGYEATLFTASFPNCLTEEAIDNVRIIRQGNRYSVYKRARAYFKATSKMYDAVVDEINTRPFLTPTFIQDKPIIALFHQMAREFWFYETPFPLNYIGRYYLEKKWLSHYEAIPTITVSDSSRKDLEELKFQRIFVVPEGLNIKPVSDIPQKESHPTLIFTGRLKKAKLPHHALKAFSIVKRSIPEAKMWIIGDGYMRNGLERMNIEGAKFYGRIRNEEKYNLMSRAHVALVPAVREGWGLVVTESNAMGTPAVAYNVPGLRDSVKDNETGILSKENTPESLAEAAIELLTNKERLAELSHNALQFSRQFNWDHTANAFDNIIKTVSAKHD